MASIRGTLQWLFGRRPATPQVPEHETQRRFAERRAGQYGDFFLSQAEMLAIRTGGWLPVHSSAVRRIRWQFFSTTRTDIGDLWVTYKKGSKDYKYPNVPLRIFQALIKAPSTGQYMWYVIRPMYSVGRGRSWRMRAA